jgi:hypothetical protein
MTVAKILDISSVSLKNFNFTFFTLPNVLGKVSIKTDWWGYYQGQELICIWPIPINPVSECPDVIPFSYYVGPVWKIPLPSYPEHRSLKTAMDVYFAFLDAFDSHYHSFISDLPTNIIDMRPFLWWSKNKKKINVDIKHTAVLKVEPFEVMTQKFRQVRRWELKNFNDHDLITSENYHDISEVLALYSQQKFNSDLNSEFKIKKVLGQFLSLGAENACNSLSIKDRVNGELLAFCLLGTHNQTTNIILNLVKKDLVKERKFMSTFLMKTIFEYAHMQKVDELDFNGSNSMKLSDAKQSFGVSPKIYYQITKSE